MTARTSYDAVRLALQHVVLAGGNHPTDLTVAAGDMVAVTGWDSSDLLWSIAGLQPVSSGEIFVDGHRVTGHEQALAAGVALIPEGSALASLLTAFENVVLPLVERPARPLPEPAGASDPESDPLALARQALAALGLSDRADHLVEELSGGQQQRVAVARAVAAKPRVLLADQATTDLDVGNRTRVVALLRELAVAGTAVLVASDDPAVIAACDRVVTR